MKRTAEWSRLAQNLDPALVRLLPCDPKVATSITEVSKASDARVAAVTAYLESAIGEAQRQTEGARQVLTSAQALSGDLSAEKSDLVAERAGLDGQIANLTQSSASRGSFSIPGETLKQTLALQQQRSDTIDSATAHGQAAGSALSDLIVQLQARQTAWADVRTAFETEAARWTAYYAARQARAQMECSITKGSAGPSKTPAPKSGAAPARGTGKQP